MIVAKTTPRVPPRYTNIKKISNFNNENNALDVNNWRPQGDSKPKMGE